MSPVSRRNRKKQKKNTGKLRIFLKYAQLATILLCLFAGWVLWLDHRILTAFQTERWQLPARVYARPVELYSGKPYSLDLLEQQLRQTGYRHDSIPDQPGEYRADARKLEIYRRSFRYWDGLEQAGRLRISFSPDGRITGITDKHGSPSPQPIRIEPRLIGKIFPANNEDRIVVAAQDIPQQLFQALIATEDKNFHHHFGIDAGGIARAFWVNLKERRISQGGSTITQQLVKNYFLTPDRSLGRKFNEIIMAVLLEHHWTKMEILTAYVNEIYLGQAGNRSVHGFAMASEFYYARPVNELRLDQIAVLAGMVKGPSFYNPRRHPDRALARRDTVLELMRKDGFITTEQSRAAQRAPLDIAEKPSWNYARYPAFLGLVKSQLLADYRMEDLRNNGLRVFTTLDPDIQYRAELMAIRELKRLEQDHTMPSGTLQVAAVIAHHGTGEILAVIGGRDPETGSFNRAIAARRQAGSLIKPAVYLTALSRPGKYSLVSRINDQPLVVKLGNGETWKPENYDRTYHGEVTLLDALVESYNAATVNLGMNLGLNEVSRSLVNLGIESLDKTYPSLLLGAVEVSPFEIAQMYQTIANGGYRIPLNSIREVLDARSMPLQRKPIQINQVIDPEPVFLVTHMLQQVVERGTGEGLRMIAPGHLPLAAKTGTTNDLRDSWFAGFGNDLLGVIWVGRDDNQPAGLTGATGAMKVWGSIMKAIRVQPLQQPQPAGIRWYDTRRSACPGSESIPFLAGHEAVVASACRR